jgi:hypothetical protein
VTQLAALVEALRAADIDRDQALAVFDGAAWSAWGQKRHQHRKLRSKSSLAVSELSALWRRSVPAGTAIIGRIADYPIHKIDDLLPWQWKS